MTHQEPQRGSRGEAQRFEMMSMSHRTSDTHPGHVNAVDHPLTSFSYNNDTNIPFTSDHPESVAVSNYEENPLPRSIRQNRHDSSFTTDIIPAVNHHDNPASRRHEGLNVPIQVHDENTLDRGQASNTMTHDVDGDSGSALSMDDGNGDADDGNTIGLALGGGRTTRTIAYTSRNTHSSSYNTRNAAVANSRVPSPFELYLARRSRAVHPAASFPTAGPTRADALRSPTRDGEPGPSRPPRTYSPSRDSRPVPEGLAAPGATAIELEDMRQGPTIRRLHTSPSGFTGKHTWDLPKATRVLWRGAMRQSWVRLAVCGIAEFLIFGNLCLSIGFVVCRKVGGQEVETGLLVWLLGSLGLFLLVTFGFGFALWRDGKAVRKIEEDEAWIGGKVLPPIPAGESANRALTVSAPAAAVAFGREETGGGAGRREGKGKDKEVVKSASRRSLLRLDPYLSEPEKPVGSSGEGAMGLGSRSDTQPSISSEMGTAAPESYSPLATAPPQWPPRC